MLIEPRNETLADKKKRLARLYEKSITDNDAFWGEQGKRIDWIKPYSIVNNSSYEGDVSIKWYEDGQLNACYNCIDRHLPEKADKIALIWEGDEPTDSQKITYQKLHDEVCLFANILKAQGARKGDRVTIYMPMIPEAVYAMLACARIGAVHSVVFGGFSPTSLKGRILDCKSTFVVTADEGVRGGKKIPLKANVDEALKECPDVKSVIVTRRTGSPINWIGSRDIWLHEAKETVSTDCPVEVMGAEDPLFILYTSGSTGKPKGVLHTTGGYMVYTTTTFYYVFDHKADDIYWCTADVGWITGHSYIVYGPLSNGATALIFEGVPNYPDFSRFWEVIDKHKVTIFYTAPTAIRALLREGNQHTLKTNRKSLRILGTVGEPINREAWLWYYSIIGKRGRPIIDTWWQTETGGIMISPLPRITKTKPGSAMKPFFGIEPVIVDENGNELTGACEGRLCFSKSWPGQMRSLYGDHKRFKETYFSTYPGKYFTGDGCARDEDGDYWITGRVDDVINVSGHRLGTAEIENAIDEHEKVAESAVVGYPHDIKGQGIYAYITLNADAESSDEVGQEIKGLVRKIIGPIASLDVIQFTPALPKTRSGKIMRRILRKIAENDIENLGDISTLADSSVVQDLVEGRARQATHHGF